MLLAKKEILLKLELSFYLITGVLDIWLIWFLCIEFAGRLQLILFK